MHEPKPNLCSSAEITDMGNKNKRENMLMLRFFFMVKLLYLNIYANTLVLKQVEARLRELAMKKKTKQSIKFIENLGSMQQ